MADIKWCTKEGAEILSVDDSPAKLTKVEVDTIWSPSRYSVIPIGSPITDFDRLEDYKKVLLVKQPGYGQKAERQSRRAFYAWADQKHEEKDGEKFWECQYHLWKNDINLNESADFMLLVATDIMDSCIHRLNFFLKDGAFMSTCDGYNFEPYTEGVRSLSYSSALKFWKEYARSGLTTKQKATVRALHHAEKQFVTDLKNRGLATRPRAEDSSLVTFIRTEVSAFLDSNVKHTRNQAAHLFSHAVHQDSVTRACCEKNCNGDHNTVYAMTDVVNRLNPPQRDSLVKILVYFEQNVPEALSICQNVFRLQISFLRALFEGHAKEVGTVVIVSPNRPAKMAKRKL